MGTKKKTGKDKSKKSEGSMYSFPQGFFDLEANLKKSYFKPYAETVETDQIIVIEKFFDKDLCRELINSFSKSSELKLETTPLVKSKDYATRVNDRAQVIDENASETLWKYLKPILLAGDEENAADQDQDHIKANFEHAISLNSNLRIYRYSKGQFFDKHYDESVDVKINDGRANKVGKTKWTLLIYLTGGEEFEGGGTVFYPENGGQVINVHPSKGMALLHKHGDECLLHEGEIVKRGEKWVLRSDIVYSE